MMGVLNFDVRRRYTVITQAELSDYSLMLATAVTEALLYFIGRGEVESCQELRYSAVTAAHIIHMLRDTIEDIEAGYFNIPGEYLQTHEISPLDVDSPAFREWVFERVQLAEGYFKTGRDYLAQIKNLRCRLAGYAYLSHFESLMRTIERENYVLRPEYPEKNSLGVSLSMGWSILINMFRPGPKKI
jgi:phytoene/squalene synthetase